MPGIIVQLHVLACALVLHHALHSGTLPRAQTVDYHLVDY